MAEWRFRITPEAEGDLDRLDTQVRQRMVEKLHWLVANFEYLTPFPLGGKWEGFFKLRVGDWRIIYDVDNQNMMVVVHAIGRRDEIYERKK